MTKAASITTPVAAQEAVQDDMSLWIFAIALACLVWCIFIVVVQVIGFTQLYETL